MKSRQNRTAVMLLEVFHAAPQQFFCCCALPLCQRFIEFFLAVRPAINQYGFVSVFRWLTISQTFQRSSNQETQRFCECRYIFFHATIALSFRLCLYVKPSIGLLSQSDCSLGGFQ